MLAPGRNTRILIGAASFADAEAAIRLAEQIVAILPAELGGVLVDEGLMADIVRFPGQRVVTSGGSLLIPPSVHQIRTLIEGDARAFRDKLSMIARTRTLKWSFERRSGDLIRGLCEAAQGWDILLLGHREMHKRPGQVVVVTFAPPVSEKAEQLASDLAQMLRTGVLELSLSTKDGNGDLRDLTRLTMDDKSELFTKLSRINASAVVVDLAASPLQTQDDLRQLLDAARCPVFVLGAAQKA